MLIICPSCTTSYEVALANLLPGGRPVRCPRCGTAWQGVPTHAEKLLAAAAAIGPAPGLAAALSAADTWARLSLDFVEAPTEPASETAWSDDCGDALFDDEQPAQDGTFAVAGEDEQPTEDGRLAATVDDQQAAEGVSFAAAADNNDLASVAALDESPANEPGDTAEVEVSPMVPANLYEDRLPIEIDPRPAAHPDESLDRVRSFAGWRHHLDGAGHWSPPRWPMSRLHAGILALLIVDCILVGWRSSVVRAFPQTDSFYKLIGLPVNLRGLAFDGVTTATEQGKGVPVLVVEGHIVNGARKLVDVPRLKFVVRNAAQQEIYSWTAVASRTLLPPGEAVSFRTRLASPPPDAHDVLLRFVDRRDIVAAAR